MWKKLASRDLVAIPLLILLISVGSTVAAETPSTRTAHLVVNGMVTPNCPVLVKTALGRLEGVRSVEASQESKRVSVVYQAETITAQRIVEVLEDQVGLSAEFIREARFSIDGMVTPNCPVLVKKAVGRLPGILEVDANLKTLSATVVFIADQLSTDDIVATIVDQVGLQATHVPER
jgi:copper ion binding protein